MGCGWGGLAMYAAEHYSVSVLGITLSEQQAHYASEQIARSGLGAHASVKLRDYRNNGCDRPIIQRSLRYPSGRTQRRRRNSL
jgi:tRNA1(Val) A37 N6-methylase TrmN6